MENKGILILGASGLVGRYLFNYLKRQQKKVIGTYHKNKSPGLLYFDVTKSLIDTLSLDDIGYAVICSAITKLDRCKNNPELSYSVNVKGLEKIMAELDKKDILPIFMSSASVFDGVEGGYKEEDKRNPTSLYGKQKLEVENFIFSNFKDFLIIRPGKVFGVKKGEGVLFTEWLEKYKQRQEIRCADDEKLSPIYAEDVARGINLLIDMNERGIYHVNPPIHLSRFEMAQSFFNYLGIRDARIIRCSIDDFDFLEKRSKNTFLDASKFIKKTGFKFTPLEECFELIKQNI